eukprot:TRINITY_DN830_c0_g1_i2.p1 TRINITY_DN830_c0_g1~~TRINITY_DN830_c0_g1_i2.p1  ORF type:complete len:238 (+),score=61.01 TRINITY_DN830_c0_g1_i2:96-809(+)
MSMESESPSSPPSSASSTASSVSSSSVSSDPSALGFPYYDAQPPYGYYHPPHPRHPHPLHQRHRHAPRHGGMKSPYYQAYMQYQMAEEEEGDEETSEVPDDELQPDSKKTCFLGRLWSNIDKERLQSLLLKFGEVEEVKIMPCPPGTRAKGYGFVTFVEEEAAQRLKEGSLVMDGKTINVSEAIHKKPKKRMVDPHAFYYPPMPYYVIPYGTTPYAFPMTSSPIRYYDSPTIGGYYI